MFGLTKGEWESFSRSKEWSAVRSWIAQEKLSLAKQALATATSKEILDGIKGTAAALTTLAILPEEIIEIMTEEEETIKEKLEDDNR